MADMETGKERQATDAGLTADKINASDPAAAPVHTDAEASGSPTSGKAATANLKRLMDLALATPQPETFGSWGKTDEHHRRLGWLLAVWTIVLVVLGLIAGWIGLM